jgi:uncharacterized protein
MNQNKCVLIGGGSGMIGSRLTTLLMQNGYQVRHLGRKAKDGTVKTFTWDIEKMTIDPKAFEGVDVVINLAGANVNGKRWTNSYKKELVESRTKSTKLIVDVLNTQKTSVSHFISGSAIGYYGFGDNSKWFTESDPSANDFLARLVAQWENEASKVDTQKVTLSYVRTGIVLAKQGGALEAMITPVKFLVGSPLGSGKQYVSWIHIEDICRLFIHLIENKLAGPFNGVAPDPATNEDITKGIAKRLHKPLWMPNVPAFALKIVLGEMSEAVLNGAKVSSKKIEGNGFTFEYPTLYAALNDLIDAKR